MIRLPGGHLARRVDTVVESVDLMPTLLELAGAPLPAGVQGSSLVPFLTGRPAAGPHAAFSESPFFGRSRAVAFGSHHLLLNTKTGATELYDVRNDPLEQDDIAASKPPVLEIMAGLLHSWQEEVASSTVDRSGEPAPLDEETLEQLRQLGYVQ
jgi:arylsulfatase A-like enzyme